MALTYVIDTHALIWYIAGNPRLGPNPKRILDDLSNTLVLPAIALAEVGRNFIDTECSQVEELYGICRG